MPFQPRVIPKARQKQIVSEGTQRMASLEATGLLPSVAGAVVRRSFLPTASVATHLGCSMRISGTPTFKKCQLHARNKEDPTRGWLGKVGAAIKDRDKIVTETPLTARQNKMVLPQLSKGQKDDTPYQKLPCLPACFSQTKKAPPPNSDMAPWTGAARSEASFHTLFTPVVSVLHSVPCSTAGPPAFCSFSPEHGEKASATEREQRLRAKLLQGRAKQKGQSRGLPRHFKSKLQVTKLLPVPRITTLSFSRNFTFSFFELPPHQSHQHWKQRQQLLSLLMKQLQ